METVLRELVQREGFETVFNALREIVTKEYERANRDYQFFLSVTKAEAAQKDSAPASMAAAPPAPATVTVQKDGEAVAENTIEAPEAVPEAVATDPPAPATPTKTVAIHSNPPSAPKKIIRKRS